MFSEGRLHFLAEIILHYVPLQPPIHFLANKRKLDFLLYFSGSIPVLHQNQSIMG